MQKSLQLDVLGQGRPITPHKPDSRPEDHISYSRSLPLFTSLRQYAICNIMLVVEYHAIALHTARKGTLGGNVCADCDDRGNQRGSL